jgi:hypothetical protein
MRIKGGWGALFVAAWAIATPGASQETITYTYDSLGRLVGSSKSGGPNDGVSTSIQYDAADNRMNYSVTGVRGAPPTPPTPPPPTLPPPPAQQATLSVADTSGPEGTDLVFTVTKTGNEPATTFWHFGDYGAIYGTDYDGTGGYLEFAAGETSKTFTIRAFRDSIAEPAEKVRVYLYRTTGATEARSEAFGTIVDVAP